MDGIYPPHGVSIACKRRLLNKILDKHLLRDLVLILF
jgi:hypothetical protein